MRRSKATQSGSLNNITDCYIVIPNAGTIILNNLPDISDSKDAIYNGDPIIGRASPMHTYSHSGDRNISMQLHFYIVDKDDAINNLQKLRWLQSAVYPRRGDNDSQASVAPFRPPPICQIRCGDLLAQGTAICVFLRSYNVKFDTNVAWDINNETFCPFKLDVDTNWTVAYTSSNLPFQDRIITSGY